MPNLRINSSDWIAQPSPPRVPRGRTRGADDPGAGFPRQFLTTTRRSAKSSREPVAATRARGRSAGRARLLVRPSTWRSRGARDSPSVRCADVSSAGPATSRGARRTEARCASWSPSAVDAVPTGHARSRHAGDQGDSRQSREERLATSIAAWCCRSWWRTFETSTWKRQRAEGGLAQGDAGTRWPPAHSTPARPRRPSARCCSSTARSPNAASAYRSLADSTSSSASRPLYGDRIFAFDHFTPQPHAGRERPDAARGPAGRDLHLRRHHAFARRARPAQPGRAGGRRSARWRSASSSGARCSSPRPTKARRSRRRERWEDTVGWIANLLELFPDNPFTTGAEFVANGLVWLARHASGDLPGPPRHGWRRRPDRRAAAAAGPARRSPTRRWSPTTTRRRSADADARYRRRSVLRLGQRPGRAVGRRLAHRPRGIVVHSGRPHRVLRARRKPARRRGDARRLLFAHGDGRLPRDGARRRSAPLSPVDPAKSLPDRRLLRAGAAGVSAPPTAFGQRTPAPRRDRLGLGAQAGGTAPASGASGSRLHVTVVNGDLTFERLPLLVGHYTRPSSQAPSGSWTR